MFSLRRKLLLPVLVAGLGAIAYLNYVWSPQALAVQHQQHVQEIARHLDTAAELLTPLVLTGQLDVLQEDLDQLLQKNGHWKSIRLFNAQGKQLYPPRYLSEATNAPSPSTELETIETPLPYLGRSLGTLAVTVDHAEWRDANQDKHRQLFYLLASIIAGIALITGIALEVVIQAPLRRLSLAAEALSRRHFDTRLPAATKDEVGQLVSSFSVMRGDLAAYQQELLDEIRERKAAEAQLIEHRQLLEQTVTQRTADLQMAKTRLRLILESSTAGIYGVDLSGCFTFVNNAACQMLGYAAKNLIGRPVHPTIHHSRPDGTPFPAADCPMLLAVNAGNPVANERTTFWRADGSALPIAYGCQPLVSEGAAIGSVVSFMDISTQVAAEAEQERARLAAEHLSQLKSEFLANMSHEIRTPLSGVLGMAQIGLRHTSEPDRSADAFQKIITSGQLLLGVINDILDFSKLEAGKMTVETAEVDLGKALTNVLELVDERAKAKGIPIRVRKAPDFPLSCQSDSLRIGQILLNLLSNAVKFTEHGSITLSAERDEEELVFRVTDTGIGISAEALEHIFSPFEQADGSTTRKYGGTGLGLTITQRLVQLMGGRLTATSQPGEGSSFEVRLPYVANGLAGADDAYAGPRSGEISA